LKKSPNIRKCIDDNKPAGEITKGASYLTFLIKKHTNLCVVLCDDGYMTGLYKNRFETITK
jgi:hypothetical protein